MSEGWRGKRHRLPWPIDLAELYALDHLAQAGAVERVGNGFREPPAVRATRRCKLSRFVSESYIVVVGDFPHSVLSGKFSSIFR